MEDAAQVLQLGVRDVPMVGIMQFGIVQTGQFHQVAHADQYV